MAVSYEQARQNVIDHIGLKADDNLVAPLWGSENDEYWSIPINTREYLIECNADYFMVGGPAYLVKRVTGQVREYFFQNEEEGIDGFRDYGDVPVFFQSDELDLEE